jgi:broad specificity phosphatase PhoE
MPIVVLLRHAECSSALLDDQETVVTNESDSLTAEGIGKTYETASFFKNTLFKSTPQVFASPIKRAQQTADIIAGTLNTSVKYFDSLRERDFNFPFDFSMRESKFYQQKAHKNPLIKIRDGESVAEHRLRLAEWKSANLDNITTDTIVVAHGGTIEQLLGIITGSAVENTSRYFFKLDYCHYHLITVLKTVPQQDIIWRIDKTNEGV